MNVMHSLLAESPGITIFGFKIYAYALIIVFGMIAAFIVISLLFKRRNMSSDLFLTFFCIGLPIAIVTTRLFYCITDGLPISEWFSFESIRKGGLSIVGGIIGGAGAVLGICLVKKVNFFRVGDCVVVGLLLAQSIGRWGNFANQEVYGGLVTNEALQFFPISVYIDAVGEWHYAFFFYESMVTLTAAILLFINAWKNGKKPNGVNTACYFIVYGLTRTIMEPLRDQSFILGDEIPWSQVMSVIMLVAGLALLFVLLYLNRKKEGKYFGSANGDPYGITEYIGDSKKDPAYLTNVNMMCKVYPENYTEKPEEEKKESFFTKLFKTKDNKAETMGKNNVEEPSNGSKDEK